MKTHNLLLLPLLPLAWPLGFAWGLWQRRRGLATFCVPSVPWMQFVPPFCRRYWREIALSGALACAWPLTLYLIFSPAPPPQIALTHDPLPAETRTFILPDTTATLTNKTLDRTGCVAGAAGTLAAEPSPCGVVSTAGTIAFYPVTIDQHGGVTFEPPATRSTMITPRLFSTPGYGSTTTLDAPPMP